MLKLFVWGASTQNFEHFFTPTFFFQIFSCSNSHLYDLDYIILQYSNTHFYNLSENMYFYHGYSQQIFFYIFSVEIGQNLAIGQKQFAP